MDITKIMTAKTWRALNIPKTKDALRDLQREFHPDVNTDPNAHEAFVKLVPLFEGPDYQLRVANGTATTAHAIAWSMEKDFDDRKIVAVRALEQLAKLPAEFNRFFPKIHSFGPDHLTLNYGEGWWFVEDFPKFDSRTAVWIAKRGAAAIKKAAESGIVHGDINPRTVALLPSEHGLMLDGWWHSVELDSRLALKPDAPTPARYFGGAGADEKVMVAQLAAMLTKTSDADKLLLETFKKHSFGVANARDFFNEVNDVATKLYGPAKWHPLDVPAVPMI